VIQNSYFTVAAKSRPRGVTRLSDAKGIIEQFSATPNDSDDGFAAHHVTPIGKNVLRHRC
jgi:hypothetical protein